MNKTESNLKAAGTLLLIIGFMLCLVGFAATSVKEYEWEYGYDGSSTDILWETKPYYADGLTAIMLGGILIIVGIIAFAMSKSEGVQQQTPPPPPIQPQQVKFCPHCGTNNPPEYNYCGQCQRALP